MNLQFPLSQKHKCKFNIHILEFFYPSPTPFVASEDYVTLRRANALFSVFYSIHSYLGPTGSRVARWGFKSPFKTNGDSNVVIHSKKSSAVDLRAPSNEERKQETDVRDKENPETHHGEETKGKDQRQP